MSQNFENQRQEKNHTIRQNDNNWNDNEFILPETSGQDKSLYNITGKLKVKESKIQTMIKLNNLWIPKKSESKAENTTENDKFI